jgi:hypothetical protein
VLQRAGFKIVEMPSIFPNRIRGKSNTNWKEVKNNLVDLFKIMAKYG